MFLDGQEPGSPIDVVDCVPLLDPCSCGAGSREPRRSTSGPAGAYGYEVGGGLEPSGSPSIGGPGGLGGRGRDRDILLSAADERKMLPKCSTSDLENRAGSLMDSIVPVAASVSDSVVLIPTERGSGTSDSIRKVRKQSTGRDRSAVVPSRRRPASRRTRRRRDGLS